MKLATFSTKWFDQSFTVARWTAWRIAGVYLIFGLVWILFSDRFVGQLGLSATEQQALQTFKGWVFVGLSTLLIFFLVWRGQQNLARHQVALKHQVARFDKILANVPQVAVVVFDFQANVLLRRGQPTVLAQIENALLRSEQFLPRLSRGLEIIAQGKSLVREIDYGEHTYEWRFMPLYEANGQVSAALAVVVDISKQKQLERQLVESRFKAEENDSLKATFLSNLSHEVRTPLNSILGFAELVSQTSEQKEETKHFAKIIRKSGQQLSELIDNLLELSAIQIGQTTKHQSVFSIGEFMRNMESRARMAWPDIRLEQRSESDGPDALVSDPAKLAIVLDKLLSNAYKFSSDLWVQVTYRIADGHLHVRVADNGPGIPPEREKIVFEPFRQLDDSDTRQYGGAGLGLSIAKGLVEALGGRIWFEPRAEGGTIFVVQVPAQAHTANPEPLLQVGEYNHLRHKRILVVEDDQGDFELLQAILEPYTPELSFVENAEKALLFCATQAPDLAIIDVFLPQQNGVWLMQQLRAAYPQLTMLAYSAFVNQADAQASVQAGAAAIIRKPIDPAQALQTIYSHCMPST